MKQFKIKQKILPLLTAAVALAAVFAVAGCREEAEKSPERVVIAMQSMPNDLMAAKSRCEKELGTKVIFMPVETGVSANNALETGHADIATVGTAPIAAGISNGINYEVIWIHNIEGENESLVAKKTSGIDSFRDLVGKKVAVPFGSTTHYSLLSGLKMFDVNPKDVKIVDMKPGQIPGAWNRGEIDAAFVWQPTLGMLRDAKTVITGRRLAELGIVTADVCVANREFAEKYPHFLQKFIKLQMDAHDTFEKDPKGAAKDVVNTLNISPDEAINAMSELVWLTDAESLAYLGKGHDKKNLAHTLKETADFLAETGSIKKAADYDTFDKAVNGSYAEAAYEMRKQNR